MHKTSCHLQTFIPWYHTKENNVRKESGLYNLLELKSFSLDREQKLLTSFLLSEHEKDSIDRELLKVTEQFET